MCDRKLVHCREYQKQAPEHGGTICNIGSIDSFHPSMVGLAAYDASKGGMLMFTRNFAVEAAAKGIRVNMIAPGGITTEGVSKGMKGVTEEQMKGFMEQFTALIPLGRFGDPDEVTFAIFSF